MRVYTPVVPVEPAPQNTQPSPPDPTVTRRRRPPSKAEQRRREQWGKEWGAVGAAHKRKLEAEGK